MTEAEKYQQALETLKILNAAVITTRLYPPSFPQVEASVEKAFDSIRNYLRHHDELSFSLQDDEPILCGRAVSEKTLGKTHGEDVFQQLRLLHMSHVVLVRGLSRKQFQQIMVFFTTSPQLVQREGGARAFVTSLGIGDYFPTEYHVELAPERQDYFVLAHKSLTALDLFDEKHIAALLEELRQGESEEIDNLVVELIELLDNEDAGTTLLVAAISAVLQGVHRGADLFFPPEFKILMSNVEELVAEPGRKRLSSGSAKKCLALFDDFALHTLILQNFSGHFAEMFYGDLISSMTSRLEHVIAAIREDEQAIGRYAGRDSEQYRRIVTGRDRVLGTTPGKQFLAREKALELIAAGEKERRAKRVQAGINAIIRGDVNALRNKEVLRHLPATVESLISRNKDKLAAAIITNITTELIKGDAESHGVLSESLGLIGESLINTKKWEWLEKLSVPLMAWIKGIEQADDLFERIVRILQKLVKYYWKTGKDEKADKILKLFFAIRTGKLKKLPEHEAVVARVQDESVEKAPLAKLLERCLAEDNELVDRRLIMQGPLVGRFLLNHLFLAKDVSERMKILDLLAKMGPILPPLLLEKIDEPMPWHSKRNLIKLLTETGNKRHIEPVFEYLHHDDVRVQKEAFYCLYKLSGDDKKETLLKALSFATGHMRQQVVRALTPLADDEVVEQVAILLDSWEHFSDEIRENLIIQICGLLGKCPSKRSRQALEDFLANEGRPKGRSISDVVWQAVKAGLRQWKALDREAAKQQIRSSDSRQAAQPETDQQTSALTKHSSFVEESHISSLLQQDREEEARKALVDLIEKACELHRFREAASLREWLIEIAPTALTDIIRSAEIIEEAKSAAIDDNFLHVWSTLYERLTTEEFNALYFAMVHERHGEEVALVKQGVLRPALYFVNSGEVKLFFHEKGSEVLLKVVRQGGIFGIDTFFQASVWTVNATTMSPVDVSILPWKNCMNWKTDLPSLEARLQNFCEGFDDLESHLRKTGKSRRNYERHAVRGRVTASILAQQNKDSGIQVSGEMVDISRGGISFVVRISQKKNAMVLLGRKARLLVPCQGEQGKHIQLLGEFVTLRSLYSMNNEFSAHIKFDKSLSEEQVNGIISASEIIEK